MRTATTHIRTICISENSNIFSRSAASFSPWQTKPALSSIYLQPGVGSRRTQFAYHPHLLYSMCVVLHPIPSSARGGLLMWAFLRTPLLYQCTSCRWSVIRDTKKISALFTSRHILLPLKGNFQAAIAAWFMSSTDFLVLLRGWKICLPALYPCWETTTDKEKIRWKIRTTHTHCGSLLLRGSEIELMGKKSYTVARGLSQSLRCGSPLLWVRVPL